MGTVFSVRAYPGHGMVRRRRRRPAWSLCLRRPLGEGDVRHGCGERSGPVECRGNGVSVPVSPELEKALLLALDYARLTKGAFDPTLGPPSACEEEPLPRRSPVRRGTGTCAPGVRMGKAVRRQGGRGQNGSRNEGDLGGMGKGFAVDRMAEILRKNRSFFIDSTSDVMAGAPTGGRGWRVLVDEVMGRIRCCC
ncbi:MAG: FAD:protein FMN transferase [Akkermansia sp.]